MDINASHKKHPSKKEILGNNSTVWETVTGQGFRDDPHPPIPRIRRGSLLQTEVFDETNTGKRVFGSRLEANSPMTFVDYGDNDSSLRMYMLQQQENNNQIKHIDNSDYEDRAGVPLITSRPSTGRKHFSHSQVSSRDVIEYKYGPDAFRRAL